MGRLLGISPSLSEELVWPPRLGACPPPGCFLQHQPLLRLTDWLLGRKDVAGLILKKEKKTTTKNVVPFGSREFKYSLSLWAKWGLFKIKNGGEKFPSVFLQEST